MPKSKTSSKKPKLPAVQQLPSGAYRAQAYLGKDENGKPIRLSFTNADYDTVLRWALDQKREHQRDNDLRSNPGKLTFGEALDHYIESKSAVLSPSTIREYKRIRHNNLQGLMPIPLNRITQNDIQVAINQAAVTMSPKTIRNHHGLITAVLAVYLPSFKPNTTLPKKIKPDIYIPTEEELKKVLAACADTSMEIPVLLAACCGMRRSEICALKWSDINFKKNTLSISGALVFDENYQAVEKGTKTTAGKRTIPMMPPVRVALEKAYATHGDNEHITSLTLNAITNAFPHLLNRAGVNHFRFHDLRHYVVSLMLYLNIPKKYIADYVGHESENMIDHVYGHIMQDKKSTFTDLLAEHLNTLL